MNINWINIDIAVCSLKSKWINPRRPTSTSGLKPLKEKRPYRRSSHGTKLFSSMIRFLTTQNEMNNSQSNVFQREKVYKKNVNTASQQVLLVDLHFTIKLNRNKHILRQSATPCRIYQKQCLFKCGC